MRNVPDRSCRENQNTHFVFSNLFFFFRKSCRLRDVGKKYCRAGQAIDDNIIGRMRIACRIPKATKHTLRICNAYCYFTATMVARTRLNVKLYVNCLSYSGPLPKMTAGLKRKALLSVPPHKPVHSPFRYYRMQKINGTASWCPPLDNFHITFRRKRSKV